MSSIRRASVIGCLLVVLILVVTGSSRAEIPKKINYQGRIIDSVTGEPLRGNHDIMFKIYDSVSDGDMLWSEQQTVSADSAGVVSVVLGSSTSIDITFEGACWLEVEVDGEALLPRREIVSVPYAFHALNSDSLGGLGSASFSLIGHSHDEAYVNVGEDSSVTASMVLPDIVSSIDGVTNDGGDIDLVAGSNITITPDDTNNRITIEATGGAGGDITAVYADDGLSGGATTGDAHLSLSTGTGLEISGDAVGLASDYSTGSAYDSRFVNEDQASSVTASMVTPDIVSSIDGVTNDGGDIDLVAGSNITITPNDVANTITIGATGVGDGHSLDAADGSPSNALYVDNAGEVGIGTTSAAAKLDVRGTVNVGIDAVGHDVNFYGDESDGRLFWDASKMALRAGSDNGTGNWDDANTGEYSMALGSGVKASGEWTIALGRNASAEGYGSASIGMYASTPGVRSTAIGSYVEARESATMVLGCGDGPGEPLVNDIPYSLMIGVDSSEPAIFVNSSGQVGIGTTDPQFTLNVDGTIMAGPPGYTGPANARLMVNTNSSYLTESALLIRNPDGFLLRLLADGKFALGHMSPRSLFHVQDSDLDLDSDALHADVAVVEADNAIMGLYSSGGGPAGSAVTFGEITGGALVDKWAIVRETTGEGSSGLRITYGTNPDQFQNSIMMYLDDSGKIGIGASSFGSETFRVNGSGCATGGWSTCSDLQFKENIENLENALDTVLKLRGVRFNWRRDEHEDRNFPEGAHYGVIAQEAEEVLPEIVKEGPEGEKSVAYSEIIPVLIESMRELRAENDAMKERIAALEASRD